ncbi:MAG: M48 family metalloprotease [Alphaproteobacteria bacterium]|nr:M48 family metalloprotease [Alphaproteobacteria bacterium]
MARARYVNGLAAVAVEIEVEAQRDGLALQLEGGTQLWPWDEIARADDRVGPVVLKRKPESGARLTLDAETAADVRAAAPHLFRLRSQRFGLVIALMAFAAVMTVTTVYGAARLAEPIARNAPPDFVARVQMIAEAQLSYLVSPCPSGPRDAEGLAALFDLTDRIGEAAGVSPARYDIHVVEADFSNAFATPGGRIIVTDNLIDLLDTPDELAGVIAHEMGHVAEDHVMVSLIKNMGIGVFIDIVLGGQGAGLTLASFNVVSLRHDRGFESAADRFAVRALDQAGLDPGGLAAFFRRVAEMSGAGLGLPELLSTHPDPSRRAEALAGAARPGRPAAMTAQDWSAVKSMCGLEDPAPPPPAPFDGPLSPGLGAPPKP